MASKTYEIAFKIMGKQDGKFAKAFKTANAAVKGFNGNLNQLNKRAANVDKVVKLRKETGEAARAYVQAKQKVAELGRAISATDKPTQKMTAEFNKAKAAVEKAKTSLDRKKSSLKTLESQVGTTGTSLKTLIERQKQLEKSADRARRSQEKLAKINERLQKASDIQGKLKSAAGSSAASLAGIGAAVAGTVGVPVKQAMAMEDAMAEVRKVTDYTPEGLVKARQELEMMSTKIPMSADGLAQIMASAAQSGVAQKDLLGFTEQAAKMGVAFDITAEEAGTMMAKWQSGMGLTQKQTYQLADAVNALSNENAATAPQIGEVLKRYGALGKVAGLTEKQTAAFAASVVASGAEAEVAATGIKAFMRSMSKGGSMSAKQAAAFENVGLNPKQIQKNLQKDAPAAIIQALEAIQKTIPKEKWNQYLSVMFGEEAAVAVGPMMQNLEGLKKNFKMVGDEANYSGSMLKEFEARSATTSNALTLAKNAASYASRAIGEPLLAPIRELSAAFVQNAIKVGNWIKNNQKTVMTMLKVGGAIVGVVSAFHAMRIAVSFVVSPLISLYKGYQNLQKVLTIVKGSTMAQAVASKAMAVGSKIATAAQWVFNSALWACPLTWIIAGIVAVIAIGVLLYKNWDKVKAGALALWEAVKNCFNNTKNKVLELWQTFQQKFPILSRIVQLATLPMRISIQAVIIVFKLLKAAGIALWNGIKWCWNKLKSATVTAWKAIEQPLMNAWAKFKEFGAYIWGTFKSKFVSAWQGIRDKIASIFSGLVGLIKKPMNAVISLVNKAIGKINGISVEIPEWAGGGKLGFNIAKIPQLATGGIATKPTLAMIGEGSESEAVLPLSKLKTLIGGGTGGTGGGISINFAPTINISGGGSSAYAEVERGLKEGQKSLKKELEKLMQQQRRLSYV